MRQTETVATTASILADQTNSKAVDLANATALTATALATETAKTTAIMSNDLTWVKQSLVNIQNTLKDMIGMYITKPIFDANQLMTDDHEKRLRIVEQRIQLWAGGLLILSFAIPILTKIFFK